MPRSLAPVLALVLLAGCGSSDSSPAPAYPAANGAGGAAGSGGTSSGGPTGGQADVLGTLPPVVVATLTQIQDQSPEMMTLRPNGHFALGTRTAGVVETTGFYAELDDTGALAWSFPSCAHNEQISYGMGPSGALACAGYTYDDNSSGIIDRSVISGTNADGTPLWQQELDGTMGSLETSGMDADANDATFVLGTYGGTPALGGMVLPKGMGGVVVAKLDPMTGSAFWTKTFEGANANVQYRPSALVVDGAGNPVFHVASAKGGTDFGGGPITGGALVSLSTDGAFRWSLGLDIWTLGRTPNGFAAIVANPPSAIDGVDLASPPATTSTVALVSFGDDGKAIWGKWLDLGSLATDVVEVWSLSGAPDGSVLVGAQCQNGANFGAGVIAHDGDRCCFGEFGPDGTLRFAGSIASCYSPAVAFDAAGAPVAAITIERTVDFGGGMRVEPASSSVHESSLVFVRFATP